MKEMIVTTKKLTKAYHGQKVVNSLSLEIPKNQVYGLLGANGAGKSTTLKMIAGLIKPSEGEIFYENHPWKRQDLGQIGALIESPPLYGNLTAQENLLVRTITLGIPESRINEVLELVGLRHTGKKKARQFSMGMKQRLGLALALLNRPKLLILDEPTNGLDPLGIQALRELIRSFPSQGISVILSSHILSEVESTVDSIGIIANGQLGYQGELPENNAALEKLFMDVVKEKEMLRILIMTRFIQAELLKGKRSFGRKGLIIFPLLVSLMAIFLMGGQFTQVGAYNWWYMLLLPMVVGLICTNLIDSDKRFSFYNVNILPFPVSKIWQGKIWTGILYLAFGNGLIFGLTTISGVIFSSQYPFWRGITAGIVLTLTWSWQIPFGLFLASRFNSVVTFLGILFLNILCSGQTIAGGDFWYLPFAIPPRMMAPIIGINPNGIPLEAGSPLHDTAVIFPGLIITVSLLFIGYFITTKWFSDRGRYHESA